MNQTTTRRCGLSAGLLAIGFLLALAWDRAIYLHLAVTDPARLDALRSSGWYLLLRNIGDLRPWLVVAVVFCLVDAGRGVRPAGAWLRRGVFLILAAAGSGAAAEALKLIFRRVRPDAADGWYRFVSPLEHTFSSSGLGFPSSHAAVAFGAALALSMIFPRAAFVFVLGAIGCAVTRLLSGAHFFSDAYGAVVVAYAVVCALYHLDRRNNPARPIDEPPAVR